MIEGSVSIEFTVIPIVQISDSKSSYQNGKFSRTVNIKVFIENNESGSLLTNAQVMARAIPCQVRSVSLVQVRGLGIITIQREEC